jgi:hypothetical protein
MVSLTLAYKIVFLKSWFILIEMTIFYGSYFHFQEDSNTIKYVLFGYYMSKLWIFEFFIIASLKAWVGNIKLQSNMIYCGCTFMDCYNMFLHCRPSFSYSRKCNIPGFRKTTFYVGSHSFGLVLWYEVALVWYKMAWKLPYAQLLPLCA